MKAMNAQHGFHLLTFYGIKTTKQCIAMLILLSFLHRVTTTPFHKKKQKQNRNVIPRAVGSWGLSWDPSFFSFFEKLKDVLPCLRPPLPLGFSQHYDACIWTHFPTELKQCRKFAQRSDICFLKAKRVYKKTSLTVKSNKSGFWSYFTSKLRNFETRFWARDMCPCVLWWHQWIALE